MHSSGIGTIVYSLSDKSSSDNKNRVLDDGKKFHKTFLIQNINQRFSFIEFFTQIKTIYNVYFMGMYRQRKIF